MCCKSLFDLPAPACTGAEKRSWGAMYLWLRFEISCTR
ncbi:unnamed protein product [Ixodes persulcatus]